MLTTVIQKINHSEQLAVVGQVAPPWYEKATVAAPTSGAGKGGVMLVVLGATVWRKDGGVVVAAFHPLDSCKKVGNTHIWLRLSDSLRVAAPDRVFS